MISNKRPAKFGTTLKSKHQTYNNFSEIQQLPIQNNTSQIINEKVSPKKGHQQDRFQGPVDPQSNLRSGKGTYHYQNKYFQYHGNYVNGHKNGEGQFRLGDGTVIKGTFVDDELIGEAEIKYADGSTYKGNIQYGQKSGFGSFKSKFQSYEGQYKSNKKQGKGVYKNSKYVIQGQFVNDKPHGEAKKTAYNYLYVGQYQNGLKSGKGFQKSQWLGQQYEYSGQFNNDRFEGPGKYINHSFNDYSYEGQFMEGKPKLYPNQFKISFVQQPIQKQKSEEQSQKPSKQNFSAYSSSPIQYQLQSQICYQGPQQLDPVQPTPQQIQKMVKDWQNQNKKNKNPPPMPDFNQPRMIKPQLILVQQQVSRPIIVKLCRTEQIQGQQSEISIKIDYRSLIANKRKENQQQKAQLAKKAQQQGAKKGGKGPAKGGEPQLKVNAFVENPTQQDKILQIKSQNGIGYVQNFELPDDFPPGNYILKCQSAFKQFGEITPSKISLCVKPKNVGKKK